MLIHIQRDGEFFGPYTLEQVRAYVASGHLLPDDGAWVEDTAQEWVPLQQLIGKVSLPSPETEREEKHLPRWIPPRRSDAVAPPVFIQRLSPAITPLRGAPAPPGIPSQIPAPIAYEPEIPPPPSPEDEPAPDTRAFGLRTMIIGAVLALGGIGAIVYYYESAASSPKQEIYYASGAAAVIGIIVFWRGLAQFRA